MAAVSTLGYVRGAQRGERGAGAIVAQHDPALDTPAEAGAAGPTSTAAVEAAANPSETRIRGAFPMSRTSNLL